MGVTGGLSYGLPLPGKQGDPYKLPDTPRFIIPEVQQRTSSLTADELVADDLRRSNSAVTAWSSAGQALSTLSDGFKKVGQILAALDPSSSDVVWDVRLSKDEFVVEGDALTEKQRDVIGQLVNAMPGMVEAAQSLQNAAVNVYDTVEGNASRGIFQANGYLNSYALNYYKDVEGQLSERVNFRNLVQETTKYVTQNGRATVEGPTSWGIGAMEVLASYINASAPVVIP